MTLSEISHILESASQDDYHLYFIARTAKEGLKGKERRRAIEKYDYTTYSVDIDNALRKYFSELTKNQINKAIEKNLDLVDYDYISDDTDKIQSYKEIEKISAFMKVVHEQLPNIETIPQMDSISSLVENGNLWAYCLEIQYWSVTENSFKKIQAFRKISNGKVAVDRREQGGFSSSLNTIFSTTNKKLEILHGETIKLDKNIDCLFIEDCFYVLNKRPFEQMVGLEEVIKEQAEATMEAIVESDILSNSDFLKAEVENNTSIHKKLVKIQKLGIPSALDKTTINRMKKAARCEGKTLRCEGNKLKLENKEDLDVVLKVLCDYYKIGLVTKKPYGTFSGKRLPDFNDA